MKGIIGLGNPGWRYRGTRHNIGATLLKHFASIHDISLKHRNPLFRYGTGWVGDEEIAAIFPRTYMNLSGEAVVAAMGFFRVRETDLLVIHDDIDLPLGRIRIKLKGGHGGHRGIKSVMEHLDGDSFLRLRIGVGRPLQGEDPVQWVLRGFNREEKKAVKQIVARGMEVLDLMLSEGPIMAMNRFHGADAEGENG